MTPRDDAGHRGWPDPADGELEVVLLGTYHMDNPGLDVINPEADDVLRPARQRELRDLADRLAGMAPDAVAVERPQERQDDLDDIYESYRTGARSYDEESEIAPPHPMREDPTSECRSEVVQVGFRLADRLDHDSVHAVDDPRAMGAHLEGDDADHLDTEGATERALAELDVSLPDPRAMGRDIEQKLAGSTIVETLRWLNREEHLAFNHDLMFAGALAGYDRRYLGSKVLAGWYDRNLRMVENLWRAADGDADRMLLVVGSGHVRVLRHLLTEAPMCRPVSPLDALADASPGG